uniref:HTH myb-type domain-containing protein n=1 Tax=Populus davidiana TaxID=266767 RepID=A0A6M2EDY5_9ROSI
MGLRHQNMNLVLSADGKPRLKWTQELHQRFVEAVNQLGGADRATPRSLMRVMEIPGLTLYHLKSHLQKYRLGKSQQSLISSENNQEVLFVADAKEIQSSDDHFQGSAFIQSSGGICSDGNQNPINGSFQIAQALQMQMEVQRKLHEQIEVQRHLQLRIEAQGKYLQSVLKKAQETLAGYNSYSMGVEVAKAELSRLVSMANSGCPSSSISDLTETEGSSLRGMERTQKRSAVCSMESSLTSSESSGRKEDMQRKNEIHDTDKSNTASVELPLMDIHRLDNPLNTCSSNQGKKRSGGIISDGVSVEQPLASRLKNGDQLSLGMFDLNS